MCCSVLQCVAVCCSVLQRVAVCCRVLQSVVECCRVHELHAGTNLRMNYTEEQKVEGKSLFFMDADYNVLPFEMQMRYNLMTEACHLLQKVARVTIYSTATHCSRLQQAATNWNTLQHTAAHCKEG